MRLASRDKASSTGHNTNLHTRDHYANLILYCEWETPNLDRALWSAGDPLALVIEGPAHPYAKLQGKECLTRDMKLHPLPWLKDELEALQNKPVEMRVTFSYFIEPNPSTRVIASQYHYPSHHLRFDA